MSSSSAHLQSKQPSHRGRWLLVIILIVLVVLAVFGILSRVHDQHALKDRTDQNAIPTVAVAKPKAAPRSQDLSLPGSVASWQDAEIYARTTGYIAKWYVDIGTKVKQGQKLAELDTPDVDNELRQGQAELRTDIATMNFDKVTADRYTQLADKGLVAHQTADQYVAQYKEQVATVQAAQSNVGTLESEENFKHIVAPFDGVITQRNADVGALIASGNSGTYLFVIADTSKLRVYIDVPETYAASVKISMPATVQLNTYGAKPITGSVARTADAIDATTRTLRTEVDVDNNGNTLVPGVYATVKLGVSTQSETFTVPSNTLLFRSEGLRIGVVKPDNHVQLVPVTLGRDFGSTVEVTSGLKDGDQLVLSPSDSLFDGQQVKIARNNQEPQQTAGK